jgi:hypothetical protein
MRVVLSLVLLVGCGTGADPSTSASSATTPPTTPPAPAPLGRPCTEIGCVDGLSVAGGLPAEHATAGSHRFTLELDGTSHVCTAELTGPIVSPIEGTCDGELGLRLSPVTEMVEMEGPVPGTVGVTFRLPGQYEWTLEVFGTPAQVHIVHTHDGVTVLDQTTSPTYANHQPNGPGCEPTCRRASLRL